jgi:hypothetical protein
MLNKKIIIAIYLSEALASIVVAAAALIYLASAG